MQTTAHYLDVLRSRP